MVGTWLLELYLDQLNRSMLEVKGRPQQPRPKESSDKQLTGANGAVTKSLSAPDQLTQDLRAFLKRNVDVLDVNVTVSLLAGYGRLDDLMEYATFRKVTNSNSHYRCIFPQYNFLQRMGALMTCSMPRTERYLQSSLLYVLAITKCCRRQQKCLMFVVHVLVSQTRICLAS